jgi:hypothetical protein
MSRDYAAIKIFLPRLASAVSLGNMRLLTTFSFLVDADDRAQHAMIFVWPQREPVLAGGFGHP